MRLAWGHRRTMLPVRRPLFSTRSRGMTRLVFRSVSLVLLVLVSFTLKLVPITGGWRHELSWGTESDVRNGVATWGLEQQRRRLMEEADDDHSCTAPADPPWMASFYILGMLYMFLAIAIVCDEFFVPALELMAEGFGMSTDVAGATLMAAGGSAPELFTSFIGTFQDSAVGFATIVGSAVFNVLFVIGMCAIFSKELLTLTWWPLARDCVFYSVSLGTLATVFGGATPGVIEWWEALLLFCMYLGYVTLMTQNHKVHQWVLLKLGLPPIVDNDENALFKRNSTFRAGILRLISTGPAPVDYASAAIVSRVAGDVDETFASIDTNNDGYIDKDELGELLRALEFTHEPGNVAGILTATDTNNDGRISLDEFTHWYIVSEERLRGEAAAAFCALDSKGTGTVAPEQLSQLLSSLNVQFTDDDIISAMSEMDTNLDGQISYEEFSAWFENSLFWTQAQERARSAAEHGDGLKPFNFPRGKSNWYKLYFVISFPLVLILWGVLPDVSKPSRQGRWAYATFVGSIVFIGIFSYFMVTWSEVVGATLGIPEVVMGLMILAAGTSVPDLITSVIVARQGEGDMAVSSSIGSNIFDVLVGLPVPWLCYAAVYDKSVTVDADNLFVSVIVLLAMLVLVILSIMASGWQMTRNLGLKMIALYAIFVGQDLARVDFGEC
mmetsp:Transcript_12773/g.32729  ORF Transcript_12773/g.32729 Transcript_12773/m.32729 type:complete len:669 (+) Transcript_12773:347-2353(+)